MKNLTLIYCGEDGEAGKALADSLRAADTDNKIVLCSVEQFASEAADHVIIMSDVPDFRAEMIREAYPGKVENRQPVVEHYQPTTFSAPLSDTPKKRGRPRKVAA